MVISRKKAALIIVTSAFLSMLLGVLAHFIFRSGRIHEYQTITEIERFAASLPEFPESDDNDWLDPSYGSFNASRAPSIIGRFLLEMGLGQIEPWSPKYLAHILTQAKLRNQQFGIAAGSKNFVHIKADDKTVVYVFGDVHGAFHSLVRDLHQLHQEGVIDESLAVKNDNTFLVFNGDFIDRSPYSIESLILMGTLMKANPANVIYIAGKHERNSHWLDYGLRRELVDRARGFSKSPIPFRAQINEFFHTLPEAVYVSTPSSKQEVVRIAFNAEKDLSYDERDLSPAFLEQKERIAAHQVTQKGEQEVAIDPRAAIKTEEWRSSNRIRKGLGLLDQDQGATTWAVLSSPISVHRLYLDFHYDAFARIDFKANLLGTTITKIYQDMRTLDGFVTDPPLNLISARHGDLTAKTTIKVASTMSLVRGVPTIGRKAKQGLDVSINSFNNRPDNNNYLLRLYVDNDDYVPNLARTNVLNFIKEKAPFIITPVGTPTTMSYIDSIQDKDVVVLFPITGSGDLRKAEYRNLVHFRATYTDEVRALINVLREEHGSLKFAFIYQDDSYGKGPLNTAMEELARTGITNSLALPYTRGNVNFSTHVKEIQKFQPDSIGFFATATATEEFIRQLGSNALANTKLFAISFAAESTLRKFAQRHGLKFLFGSVVPNPSKSTAHIATLYRKAMDDANHSYDVFSFEAFIAANIFTYAIEKLKDQPITPRNIMKEIEAIHKLDFNGIDLDFNPTTRSLAQHVWLETGPENNWTTFAVGNKTIGARK